MVLANPSKGFVVDIFLQLFRRDTSSNLVEPRCCQEVLSALYIFVLSLKGIVRDAGVFLVQFNLCLPGSGRPTLRTRWKAYWLSRSLCVESRRSTNIIRVQDYMKEKA